MTLPNFSPSFPTLGGAGQGGVVGEDAAEHSCRGKGSSYVVLLAPLDDGGQSGSHFQSLIIFTVSFKVNNPSKWDPTALKTQRDERWRAPYSLCPSAWLFSSC